MKNKIIKLLCLLCAIVLLGACSVDATPEEIGFRTEFTNYATDNKYTVMSESNGVQLLLNEETMDIMLQSTDLTWRSYVFTQKEIKASSTDRDNHSLFYIDGAIIGGSQFQLDSYTDCVNRDQYEVEKIDNGFKVTFVTGKLDRSRALPEIMDKESLEALLDTIEENEGKRVRKKSELWYSLYTVDTAEDEILKNYPQIARFASKYPDGLYILKTGIVDKEKDELETYFKAAGITVEYIEQYNTELDYESEALSRPIVQFEMDFTLDKGDLMVSLPADTILLDNSKYVLNSIRILENLCTVPKSGESIPVPASEAGNYVSSVETSTAQDTPTEDASSTDASAAEGSTDTGSTGSVESDASTASSTSSGSSSSETSSKVETVLVPTGETGRFFFYPDGSGVVADLHASNNIVGEGILTGRVYNTVYNKVGGYVANSVYGIENMSVPVFGFAKTSCAVLGIVESGAEVTRITANYNSTIQSIYPSFEIEEYDPANVDEMVAMSEYYTTGKSGFVYTVRYKFLAGEEVDYVDMAKTYRSYLISKGDLTADGASDEMQFYLETLGYIRANEEVAVVSVETDKVLTSYEENINLLKQLSDGGVKGLNLRLQGWANGGINNYYSKAVNLSKAMGGKDGFQKLVDYVTSNSIGFYPSTNFLTVGKVKSFDGFNARNIAARNKENQYEGVYVYIPANDSLCGFNYILNSSFVSSVITKYFEDAADYWSCDTISTDYLSTVLARSYRSGEEVTTTQTLKGVKEAFETLSDGRSVMVQGANDYAYKYADTILDVSSSNTENPSLEGVPFLQILLHGSVNFTGAAINTYSTYEDAILECVEYGTGLYFTMIHENAIYLKASEYSYYYSADDDYWVGKAIEAYATVSKAVGDCVGSEISDHEKLASGVYKTTFSNGKYSIVNYNVYDVELDGIGTVTAKGYYVG